jgi:hypothetical protein
MTSDEGPTRRRFLQQVGALWMMVSASPPGVTARDQWSRVDPSTGRKFMAIRYPDEPGWSIVVFLVTILAHFKHRHGSFAALPEVWASSSTNYTIPGLTPSSFLETPQGAPSIGRSYEILPGWIATFELDEPDRQSYRLMVVQLRVPSEVGNYALLVTDSSGYTSPGLEGHAQGLDIDTFVGDYIEARLRRDRGDSEGQASQKKGMLLRALDQITSLFFPTLHADKPLCNPFYCVCVCAHTADQCTRDCSSPGCYVGFSNCEWCCGDCASCGP